MLDGQLDSNVTKITPQDFVETNKLNNLTLNNAKQTQASRSLIEQICFNHKKPHPLLLPLTQAAFEPNELFELIKTDPQMTAKMLKRVNSPVFGLLKPITSIHHAIIYLGIGTVKNIALHYAMDNTQEFDKTPQKNAYQKLWSASYLASSITMFCAKEMRIDDAAEISTSCLLSYLGDMALLSSNENFAALFTTPTSLIERISTYQEAIGLNQQDISSALVRHWQLPRALVRFIDHSLSPVCEPLTEKVSTEEILKIGLMYLSSRLADTAIFGELTRFDEVIESIRQQGDLHCFFAKYPTPASEQILQLLNTPHMSNKISLLIKQCQ